MIDVVEQVNAVERQVGARVFEAGDARTVTVSRTYDASVEEIWDACTNPERIPRWFLPVSGELRVGGRYQLEGSAGGTIERCDEPDSFLATWEYGGDVSWIEVRLSAESGDRARFELEHIMRAGEKWAEYGPGAVGVGWDLSLAALAIHLERGSAVERQEIEAWAESEEGRAFAGRSSDGWYEADVAGGANADEAATAAARTKAEYTGSEG